MDWPRQDPEIHPHDRTVLKYAPDSTGTIVILRADNSPLYALAQTENRIRPTKLIFLSSLADRAEDRKPGGAHNPALLRYLPFSEDTFDISHTIQPSRSIHSCRTSHEWPGDLAMSMTYFPSRKVTYGVLYGCDAEIKRGVLTRLQNSEDAACHPLLLIGIFAELERKRQLGLVKSAITTLHNTVLNLDRPTGDRKEIWDGNQLITQTIDPWHDTHNLKNSLESWKEQLAKIVVHIDELSEKWFSPALSDSDKEKARKHQVRESGERIKERMVEIICDYDAGIRECVMVMEGVNYATRLARARATIEITASENANANRMRLIEFLTIMFLSATFVAVSLVEKSSTLPPSSETFANYVLRSSQIRALFLSPFPTGNLRRWSTFRAASILVLQRYGLSQSWWYGSWAFSAGHSRRICQA
ncbi:hypothetical protein O1611_g5356 [Lasiodiplodia mahajangana]|uniref:Uncharacterized protein n=1 Tax=Lasiodiplodia mahajangana TaxID=1108764 RepID=A0ACC2JLF8_9PEZI|nr:hypothetical protein O1611_g5356 [Lasiodiplodia mahajangana]